MTTRTPAIGDRVLLDAIDYVIAGWAKGDDEPAIRAMAAQTSDDPQVQEAIVAFTLRRGGYRLTSGPVIAVMKRNRATGELEPTGRMEPRWQTVALPHDLRWSDDLGSWYLWGRCLSKVQTEQVIELRDRGILPARSTRTPGHAPAGGEHLDLYLALFTGPPVVWPEQLANVRRGDGLTDAAKAAVAEFRRRWEGPHDTGYADPGDTPSADLASKPREG